MVNLKKYAHTRELFYIQKRFTKIPFLFYNYANVKNDLIFITNKNFFTHFSSKYLTPFNNFFYKDFIGPFYLMPFNFNVKDLNVIKNQSLLGVSVGNFILNRSDITRLHNYVNVFKLNGLGVVSSNFSSIFFSSFIRIYRLFIFLLFNHAYFKSINS